ncbi:MAG: DNA mismatch repair protein MutS [Maricaulis sp.]|jgi:DNA-nicking Smr family endonuclease|nr:DNA mismatch repair protein MutS [Maricaulis sp.]|tara:strand:+ start:98 stop:658 length:561 start_codon:yes stop_codon:yes gene_type:complete
MTGSGKSGRDLRPEERTIWRKVARTAKPLDPHRTGPEREHFAGLMSESAETPGIRIPAKKAAEPPKTPPADRSAEKRVRRGRIEVEARIDLHGMTQDRARTLLGRFLHSAKARGLSTVLVITGKGMKLPWRERGEDEAPPGVLRRRLPEWLAEAELRHLVSGYAPAHRRHGGEGAFYVTMRFPREG